MKKTILIFAWMFCLLVHEKVFSQSGIVTGKVSEGGISLPGVNVKVKGTPLGTTTGADGGFSIKASGTDILVFTYIGYLTKEVAVNNRSFINVLLETDIRQLNEVLISVPFGEQKKMTVTGAITTITGQDLVKAPVAGLSNALIGLSSGIQALQSSGEFGADKAEIYIRGRATLNSTGRGPLIIVDGVERETYNNIDPNEVASINILKDASSTAVYGVRGANGVIYITTKKGKEGSPVLNVTGNVAVLQPTILPEHVNSYDYAVLRNEAQRNMGVTDLAFKPEDIRLFQTGEDPIFHPSKNWIDELIAPSSLQQTYNTNVSGGSEKIKYFTYLGYFSQTGAYNKPDFDFGLPYTHSYDKYNLRMNFDFDFSKDFSMAVKIGEQITDNTSPNGGAWGAFDRATNASPMSSPAFAEGKYIEAVYGLPGGVPHKNPWSDGGPTSSPGGYITNFFANTLNTNLSLKYKLDKLTQGLSVRAMGAYDSYYRKWSEQRKTFPAYSITRDPNNPTGYILYQTKDEGPYYGLRDEVRETPSEKDKWRKMYAEVAIDYSRSFDSHKVSGLVLGNMEKVYSTHLEYKLPTGYLGLVGRVTYDFKNKYLAEFNMGYNGSENFPEGKRFGFFPAYSLGWVVSEESFMPKSKNIISFLKFRGSYGEVGNDKIGSKRYLYLEGPFSLENGGNHAVIFGEAGSNMARYNMYKEGRIGNPNVTWERAKKWNIGTELRLFKDKLSFIGDVFEEKRGNILWDLGTVPETVAAALPPANIGKVTNRGYELELGYNDTMGKFKYWLKGTYSYSRNTIGFMDEVNQPYEYLKRTGKSIEQYFGLQFEGFYNTQAEIDDPNRPKSLWETPSNPLQPGDMKYKDLNGDGRIDNDDMGPVGSSNWPDENYTFSFGGAWKGFDFSVLFQGTGDVSARFASSAALPFTNAWGPAHTWNLERWNAERYANGEKINFPRLELSPGTQHNYQPSDFWVQDAAYLRLKTVEIGYRFSAGFLRRMGLSSMRVYASGYNLVTWTDLTYRVDPDARELWGRVLPSNRVFNGGINFQF